jgi:hypothetical protein
LITIPDKFSLKSPHQTEIGFIFDATDHA